MSKKLSEMTSQERIEHWKRRRNRKEFLNLPMNERKQILKEQADLIMEHYEKDQEWR